MPFKCFMVFSGGKRAEKDAEPSSAQASAQASPPEDLEARGHASLVAQGARGPPAGDPTERVLQASSTRCPTHRAFGGGGGGLTCARAREALLATPARS